MTKIRIDPLALNTFERIAGVRAYLGLLDKAMPEVEWQERAELDLISGVQEWDYSDYDVQRQVLDGKFKHWVPRFSAYSAIVFLPTIVETRLAACAERIGKDRNATFRPTDLRGGPIEAASIFLERVTGYHVRNDPDWQRLRDLHELRNLIVHRVGRASGSSKHEELARQLAAKYRGHVEFPEFSQWWYAEGWVSLAVCRQFCDSVESFFKRLFVALGLPDKAMSVES